jgi:hypothetical protein
VEYEIFRLTSSVTSNFSCGCAVFRPESVSRRLKGDGFDIHTSCTMATGAVVASVTFRHFEDSYFDVAMPHTEGCCKWFVVTTMYSSQDWHDFRLTPLWQ